jgi:hypothetical protein
MKPIECSAVPTVKHRGNPSTAGNDERQEAEMMLNHRIRRSLGVFLVPLAVTVGACSDDAPTGLDNRAPIAQVSASPLDVPSFVGGTSASDAVIQVTFPGAAPYLVTLTVSDGNGGSDTAEITIGIR